MLQITVSIELFGIRLKWTAQISSNKLNSEKHNALKNHSFDSNRMIVLLFIIFLSRSSLARADILEHWLDSVVLLD